MGPWEHPFPHTTLVTSQISTLAPQSTFSPSTSSWRAPWRVLGAEAADAVAEAEAKTEADVLDLQAHYPARSTSPPESKCPFTMHFEFFHPHHREPSRQKETPR
jgi:hypothetical protein